MLSHRITSNFLCRCMRRMQCTWLTNAILITSRTLSFGQSTWRKNLASQNCPPGIWSIRSKPYLNPISLYHAFKPTPRTMESPNLDLPHTHLHAPTIVPPSAPSMTTSSFVAGHLSSPQISRTSAAAIRISVARGDTWDGFHLWHSLRWSMYRYRKPASSSTPQPPFRTPSPFVPIDFGRPVSTRLATHCLLHSLLRAGKTKMAANFTSRLMADGGELHPLSFGTLLRQLNSPSSESAQTANDRLRSLTPPQKVHLGPRILDLQNVMPMNPFTRIAVHLLNRAREHRWQRTTSMYESVFRACLIQGEILVVSVLLAVLLKDYQLRHACSRVTTETERVGAQDTMAYVQSKIPEASSRGLKFLPHSNSYFLYDNVTGFLSKHCTQVEDPLFSKASQALAILASEFDARRIPYANLAKLIKVLYSYPQCQNTVWTTLPSGERRFRNAYHYFNEVLHNLLHSFPNRGLLDLNTGQLPSLNVESYNALLHYALRYRHSLVLANRVLHHMTELRKLAPSTSTYNILLRDSTLMRRNDIAESVLRTIGWEMSANKPEVVDPLSLCTIQGRNSRIDSSPTGSRLGGRHRFDELLEDTRKYDLNIPIPKEPLDPGDKMLLTSYMAYLVATGCPDKVAILITRVFPEFELPKESVPLEEILARWQRSVVRGVTLGPHFFAGALNALRKAGHRRLAERVWELARAAESKALESGVKTPWCLSVHAYTAMLQIYADETKRWRDDHTVICAKRRGHPPRPRDRRRAASAMRKGMQIFHALPLAAVKVHDAAVRARKEGREWGHPPAPPRVDARFYNAALSLVYRQLGMHPCGPHQRSRSWWNHLLGKARQRFLLTGQRPRGWIPELEEISNSMRRSGYELPIGLELRLVGRDERVTSQDRTDLDARPDFGGRPYSFGRIVRGRFAPHRFPTFKRKGLPLRGRWRRSGWSY